MKRQGTGGKTGTSPAQGYVFSYLVEHWKLGSGVLAMLFFLCLAVFSFPAAGVSERDPSEALVIGRIPLSAGRLREWTEAAGTLVEYQYEGKLHIPARSLIELVEWGRTSPDKLVGFLSQAELKRFLSLSLALAHARGLSRTLREREELVEEAGRLEQLVETCADRIQLPPQLELEGWEWADLDVYEHDSRRVEETLAELLPRATPGDPSERCWVEKAESGMGEDPQAEPSPVSWRMVSTSRYGPKVVRKCPIRREYRLNKTRESGSYDPDR